MALLDRVGGLQSPAAALRRAIRLIEKGDATKAFAPLTRAAQSGIAEAQYRVGRCYIEGKGVPISRVEGARWLERSARQGYVDAQILLAALHIHGVGADQPAPDQSQPVPEYHPGQGMAAGSPAAPQQVGGLFGAAEAGRPDFDTALHWARLAGDAGSGDGQALVGYILTSGPEKLRDLDQARSWYARSSAADCPQGHLGYALALASQAKTPEERERVVALMRKAADAELPTALFLLGLLIERGIAGEVDTVAATDLFRRSAEKGHSSGQARWGVALMNGVGVKANPIEGETWLRRAALAGDREAAAVVGDLYARGGGKLPPNFVEAGMWFRRAADAGHKGAARALGLLHLTGAGVAPDSEAAAEWLRRAAQAGDRHAYADLGNLLLQGGGESADSVRTREWFEQAAASGDLLAAFNFGVCLAEGVGIDRDDAKAVEWLRRAADGVVNAQYWYGRMVTEGRGVPADPVEGRVWIARAAEVGMPEAEVFLADMLLSGRGGERNHPAALELFEKAAGRGHVGAMFGVAAMNGGGHDVPTDRVVAQRWFLAAAERGHPQAQMMLGRYLYRGLAGEPDIEKGRYWLQKALAQGMQDATADLAALPPEPEKPLEGAAGQVGRRVNEPPIMHGPGPDAPPPRGVAQHAHADAEAPQVAGN
jgi:TPR repeat protein